MLSRLAFRNISSFSKLFYQPSQLNYPINYNDEDALRNKSQMDEVNSKYSSILRKV